MSEKRYYWLKLNEDFFDDDTVTYLEEQENGHEYVIFYLKLCLKSLKDEGSLIRYVGNTLMPYDSKALAKLTNTSIDTVNVCMKAFHDIGLIEVKETGEIYMSQINEMIGSETDNAKRVRKHRLMKNKQKALQSNGKALQCNSDVTKCNTEIDIEIDIEKEIDIIPYKEVIDYLNEKAGTKYKHTTSKTKTLIKARYEEGFELDDFKNVIDKKVNTWLNTDMSKYLRPETLFGTKFEGYLNEMQVNENRSNNVMEKYSGKEYDWLG